MNAKPGGLHFLRCVCMSSGFVSRRMAKVALQGLTLIFPYFNTCNKAAYVERDSNRQVWECEVLTAKTEVRV